MHPRYHLRSDRRARLRWAAGVLAAYALAEIVAEAWAWVRPDGMARGRW